MVCSLIFGWWRLAQGVLGLFAHLRSSGGGLATAESLTAVPVGQVRTFLWRGKIFGPFSGVGRFLELGMTLLFHQSDLASLLRIGEAGDAALQPEKLSEDLAGGGAGGDGNNENLLKELGEAGDAVLKAEKLSEDLAGGGEGNNENLLNELGDVRNAVRTPEKLYRIAFGTETAPNDHNAAISHSMRVQLLKGYSVGRKIYEDKGIRLRRNRGRREARNPFKNGIPLHALRGNRKDVRRAMKCGFHGDGYGGTTYIC